MKELSVALLFFTPRDRNVPDAVAIEVPPSELQAAKGLSSTPRYAVQ